MGLQFFSGLEFMMAQQTHDISIAESSHLNLEAGKREAHWEWHRSFETSEPYPSDTPSDKAKPPNASRIVPLRENQVFQMYEPMGAFLFKHHSGIP